MDELRQSSSGVLSFVMTGRGGGEAPEVDSVLIFLDVMAGGTLFQLLVSSPWFLAELLFGHMSSPSFMLNARRARLCTKMPRASTQDA